METTARIGVIALLAAGALWAAAPAGADPDPHIPNPVMGYCPGGGSGTLYMGYCDGAKYPDGSYWHHVNYGMPWMGQQPGSPDSPLTWCVVDDGSLIPPQAPPGGCGGAV